MVSREYYLDALNTTVTEFLQIFQNPVTAEIRVYELWTAKDVLCHITFWHESFARNVDDLVNGRKPHPLKGRLSDLNQQGVDSIRSEALDTICKRLETAHQTIKKGILFPELTLIPYRIGSRDYSPEEHMDIVNRHIHDHKLDIQKAILNQ